MGILEGRVAIVTGASRGIGRACAERLAQEGAIVVLTDVLHEAGEAAAGEIGGGAEYRPLDVTSEENWQQVMAAVEARHGRLDILVNNAGMAISVPVADMALADFERQMAVNVTGTFLGCKHAIPLMRKGGRGSIVNFSSTAGLRGSLGMAGYSASKGAVRLFTKALSLECGKDNIRVNSMHPGLIATDLWKQINAPSVPDGDLDALGLLAARMVPMGRNGEPQDIAAGVLWLASDESRYVTGTEFVIDGGMTAR
jgi:NAD(P)-dependent dehydrogenase (short-subunit alcohol dehydrogenase family)